MDKSQYSSPIATFVEEDVFLKRVTLKNDSDVAYVERFTGKAVIFDGEDRVALVGNEVHGFYLLPGGGIEEGESVEVGIIRESLEEAGVVVELDKYLGMIDSYRARDKKHSVTHCYTCRVVGDKKSLTLTTKEKKNGVYVKWFDKKDAKRILEQQVAQLKNGEVIFYNTGFNILRDALFLKRAFENG